MNQQRSRRFRSSREAKEKEEARKESIALWKCMSAPVFLAIFCSKSVLLAMGKQVSDDEKTQDSWDSNAITPGTPFMHLLATSLRFWVAQKMNMDPGWKNVSVVSLYAHSKNKILVFQRSKFLFQMLECLEKESIKLWTLSDASEVIPTMTQIHNM